VALLAADGLNDLLNRCQGLQGVGGVLEHVGAGQFKWVGRQIAQEVCGLWLVHHGDLHKCVAQLVDKLVAIFICNGTQVECGLQCLQSCVLQRILEQTESGVIC